MTNTMKKSIPEKTRSFALSTLSASLLLIIGSSSLAAPGIPANSPLFLSTKVQPNIFFMIDDSGSMDWEKIISSDTISAHNTIGEWVYESGNLRFDTDSINFYWASGTTRLTANVAETRALHRRELCWGYNSAAYNPNLTYTPWMGKDNSGADYTNSTLAAARTNPFYSGTNNISWHYYYPWNDANGDKKYQVGECDTSTSNRVNVNTLTPQQQQNYANWYTFYRKREYISKRALSQLITESSARMGLATINARDSNSLTGDNDDIFRKVTDIDDISTPVNSSAANNKKKLLRSLFRIDSTNGTPLRTGLDRVGRYYADQKPTHQGVSWGDTPILNATNGGECQQNFTVLMTDGFWNGPDTSIGDADTDNNTTYDGGLYADGSTLANTDGTIGPITVGTLADVAMNYYEQDLAPGLANKVPIQPGIDDNNTQHMVTYTVAFGVSGSPSIANLKPGDGGFAWPAAQRDTFTTIDDMRHAAFNGRGQYLNAKDPQELIDTLNTAINDIGARTASASAVTFNSTNLQTNTKVLRASFDSDRWSGDVSAYSLTLDPTTKLLNVNPTPAWQASTDLNLRSSDSRTIVTYDPSAKNGIDFNWNTITSAQKNDLRTNTSGTLDNEATGKARLDYIRGNRSCEVTSSGACSQNSGSPFTDTAGNTFNSKSFRLRNSKLGDIVHSSPTFIGKPRNRYPNYIEPDTYSSFVQSQASRTGVTYIGSNDGMLHAFNDSGIEVFAYIPSFVFSTANGAGLHHLTETGYVHEYYVDLSTYTADAYFDNGSGTRSWHTALVGGLRGGGKGVFALDVTDPTSMSSPAGAASKILWEFTHNDLGYSFSEIRIGRMNNGEWAAIFGNGYNNDPNGDGTSKLFIVYLDGSNISNPIILETGAGTMANNSCSDPGSDCNGMSTPTTADINGDGSIDLIYAGDLHGNLWSFDVSSSDESKWGSTYGSGTPKTPLFQACSGNPCTSVNRQPITAKPAVTRHPFKRDITTKPNLMIFFGTGQYLTSTDNTSTAQQSFYGIWDSGVGGLNRSKLTSQTLTDKTTGGFDVRTVTDNPVSYSSTEKGWLIDFPTQKERVVTDSVKFGDLIFFNTMIPSTGACEDGGYGWRMALDIVNGGIPDFIPIDVNKDGTFDASDKVGSDIAIGTKSGGIPAAPRFIGNYRVDNDTASNAASTTRTQPKGPVPNDRMSWTGLEKK